MQFFQSIKQQKNKQWLSPTINSITEITLIKWLFAWSLWYYCAIIKLTQCQFYKIMQVSCQEIYSQPTELPMNAYFLQVYVSNIPYAEKMLMDSWKKYACV